jgi:hypothetical protein
MSTERMRELDARTRSAVDELRGLIQSRYPEATFAVTEGEDPPGTYLKATVDLDDVDEVIDSFGDRLLELQVEERLPIYVIPLQPVERVLAGMRAPKGPRKHSVADLPPLTP